MLRFLNLYTRWQEATNTRVDTTRPQRTRLTKEHLENEYEERNTVLGTAGEDGDGSGRHRRICGLFSTGSDKASVKSSQVWV